MLIKIIAEIKYAFLWFKKKGEKNLFDGIRA